MSGSASEMRGGTPSTTTPIAGPWLSPQVVKRNRVPKLLPAIRLPLDDRDVWGVGALHANDMVAAIDVMHLAGDPGRQIAKQVNAGPADLLDRDVALQWRIELVPFEDIAEVADTGGGQGLDRPGGDRVNPDIAATEIGCEIAHAGFERGLRGPHHVVMRHDPLGAVIGQGQQAATP